jgi:hypothetical protein
MQLPFLLSDFTSKQPKFSEKTGILMVLIKRNAIILPIVAEKHFPRFRQIRKFLGNLRHD